MAAALKAQPGRPELIKPGWPETPMFKLLAGAVVIYLFSSCYDNLQF